MTLRRLIIAFFVAGFLGLASVAGLVYYISTDLPDMITLADYKPFMISEVYDRDGKKIGEFYRQKRQLVEFKEIPKVVVDAFLAAEDSSFYEHGGINYIAILRAVLANLKAGDKVQGASTITQQVARSLLLTRAKTYERKIKEVLLSYRMEANLSKEDILYLYLNQIYLGQEAHGVAMATEVFFNKQLKDITLPEAAILAGLPKAPSAYNPHRNPSRAKERQRYVLSRMKDEGMITEEEREAAAELPLKVYERRTYWTKAPHFLETVRQMLISELGYDTVHEDGLQIHTSLDLEKQTVAQDEVQLGLRELDKRQGYRGPIKNLTDSKEIAEFLLKERNEFIDKKNEFRMLMPDGTLPDWGPLNLTGLETKPEDAPEDYEPKKLPVLPDYIPVGTYMNGIVTKIDDEYGLAHVRFAESKGLIDVATMSWAREPDPEVNARWAPEIKKISQVLKVGDVIEIRIADKTFSSEDFDERLKEKKGNRKNFELPEDFPDFKEYAKVELEQKPLTQAALLAIDQRTNEIISMVGGYEFSSSNQLNRSIQAVRQTGSAFKPLVYLSALDKGYNPASKILDAPIVYEEETELQETEGARPNSDEEPETMTTRWKPANHSHKFHGDILFRNALIKSLNVPSVKIIEDIGVNWAATYARRLGIFSPLNMDFTLALGSSSVTLYEITKAFAQIGRLGRQIRPSFIHKVVNAQGEVLAKDISLDKRFEDEITVLEEMFKRRRANYLAWKKSMDGESEFKPAYPIGVEDETITLTNDRDESEESPNKEIAVAANDKGEETEKAEPKTLQLPALPHPSKEPPIFFEDPKQLVKPESAFVMTSLLESVVAEPGGTGAYARNVERPVAGKTGSTSNYYDAWFLGYSPDIATGVWVGYDEEKTLGRGEVGGRSALPIWTGYMKAAHKGMSVKDFSAPDNIIFASIDNKTGRLASSESENVARQAFEVGTEPKEIEDDLSTQNEDAKDFFKEELSNEQ